MAKNNDDENVIFADLKGQINSKVPGTAFNLATDLFSAKVTHWFSTGSLLLDLIMSNKEKGGVPVGRLTEISGPEGIGKSMITHKMIYHCQKEGNIPVLIDTEKASSEDMMKKNGIDLSTLIYTQPDTVEQVFQTIEQIVINVTKKYSKKKILVIWDSVAATSTNAEMAGDYGDATVALQARLIGQGLRKLMPTIGRSNVALVFINQLRAKIPAPMFGDPFLTPGGKAIPFWATIRLRLTSNGQIKETVKGVENVNGTHVLASTGSPGGKNKIAPPYRKAEFVIRWAKGLCDEESWIYAIEKMGILDKQGYSFIINGEKFSKKDLIKTLQENEEVNKVVKKLIIDKMIIEDAETIVVLDKLQDADDELI